MTTSRGRHQRTREWILWGVPLALVAVAGALIASTQRQADYADWYHHWITAGVGALIALALARLPLRRLQPLLIPVYGLTVLSLIAVRVVGTTALGAQRWISIGPVNVQPSEFAKIAAILSEHGINIESIMQKESEFRDGRIPVIILTHTVLERQMNLAIEALESLSEIDGKVVRIRAENFN